MGFMVGGSAVPYHTIARAALMYATMPSAKCGGTARNTPTMGNSASSETESANHDMSCSSVTSAARPSRSAKAAPERWDIAMGKGSGVRELSQLGSCTGV